MGKNKDKKAGSAFTEAAIDELDEGFDAPDNTSEYFKPADHKGALLLVQPREVGTVDYGKGPQKCVVADLVVIDESDPADSVVWKKQSVSNQVLMSSIEDKLGKKLPVRLEQRTGKSGNDFYVYEPASAAEIELVKAYLKSAK